MKGVHRENTQHPKPFQATGEKVLSNAVSEQGPGMVALRELLLLRPEHKLKTSGLQSLSGIYFICLIFFYRGSR